MRNERGYFQNWRVIILIGTNKKEMVIILNGTEGIWNITNIIRQMKIEICDKFLGDGGGANKTTLTIIKIEAFGLYGI